MCPKKLTYPSRRRIHCDHAWELGSFSEVGGSAPPHSPKPQTSQRGKRDEGCGTCRMTRKRVVAVCMREVLAFMDCCTSSSINRSRGAKHRTLSRGGGGSWCPGKCWSLNRNFHCVQGKVHAPPWPHASMRAAAASSIRRNPHLDGPWHGS